MTTQSFGILIPTWDRPVEVSKRLIEIAQQFPSGQRVHVQVNPGIYGHKDINIDLASLSISISENAFNVGFVGNILYGLVHLEQEWVWILGDDDRLQINCHEHIRHYIELAEQGIGVILYNTWFKSARTLSHCDSVSSLFNSTSFGDALFISGLVWRRSFIMARLDVFIEEAFSRASQLALIATSLSRKELTVLVVNAPLVQYEEIHRWSRIDYLGRIDILFRLDLSQSEKKVLAKAFYPQWLWAVHSGYKEVLGGFPFNLWLLATLRSFLVLARADPLVPLYDLLHQSHSRVRSGWEFYYSKYGLHHLKALILKLKRKFLN